MSDTQVVEPGVTADAPCGYRLTPAAVRRLAHVLNVTEIEDIAARLDISRQTFWRLRTTGVDIRLSDAHRISDVTRWPLTRLFEPVHTNG